MLAFRILSRPTAWEGKENHTMQAENNSMHLHLNEAYKDSLQYYSEACSKQPKWKLNKQVCTNSDSAQEWGVSDIELRKGSDVNSLETNKTGTDVMNNDICTFNSICISEKNLINY